MPFARGPVLAYTGRGRYATVGPTEYVGQDDVITIPADFVTDLATVPRVFWALIPPQGAYEAAAVLHDHLCVELAFRHRMRGRIPAEVDALVPQPVSARDTDGLFRRVMREAGVGCITRWVMWVGVRWGALANPARRAGWWRDAPLVLLLSAAAAVVAVGALLGVHLVIGEVLSFLSQSRGEGLRPGR